MGTFKSTGVAAELEKFDMLRKGTDKAIEEAVKAGGKVLAKRLQSAADALAGMGVKNGNITDIARMCGFEDQSYFTKVFRRISGVTPKKYRDSRGGAKKEIVIR